MSPAARRTWQGRVLVTRAELAREAGEREHTLYKWWAGREHTGHPEAIVLDDVAYFDLAQWQAWRAEHGADRRVVDGRTLVSTAELARLSGEPLATLHRWYADRDRNGHPEAVRLGKQRYVDEQHWQAWYARHQARLRSGLTPVDRSGNPEDLLTAAEASRVLGYTSPATVHSYVRRGQFIEPDDTEELPGGGVRRRWRRRRVWEFADHRTWSRTPGRRHSS